METINYFYKKNNMESILTKNIDNQAGFEFYATDKKDGLEFYINRDISSYYSIKDFSDGIRLKLYDDKTKAISSDLIKKSRVEILKNKALKILVNEEVAVGYSSLTERFLNDLLEEDVSLLKDVLNEICFAIFSEAEVLQKFIEVMSNLDYEKLHPTNTILIVGTINHVDVGVQEATIAAYEKWDDKRNVKILKSVNYSIEWIKEYAEEVIDYLESC